MKGSDRGRTIDDHDKQDWDSHRKTCKQEGH